jgi:hypothetical protein
VVKQCNVIWRSLKLAHHECQACLAYPGSTSTDKSIMRSMHAHSHVCMLAAHPLCMPTRNRTGRPVSGMTTSAAASSIASANANVRCACSGSTCTAARQRQAAASALCQPPTGSPFQMGILSTTVYREHNTFVVSMHT